MVQKAKGNRGDGSQYPSVTEAGEVGKLISDTQSVSNVNGQKFEGIEKKNWYKIYMNLSD